MTSGFVLDCSIAVAWCFSDEATPTSDALLERVRDYSAVVPALWHWEVANVLCLAVRKQRLSQSDAQARLSLMAALPIATDFEGQQRAWRETLMLAQTAGLTVYDAAYLEVALRLGFGLATSDTALRQAATRMGVEVLGV